MYTSMSWRVSLRMCGGVGVSECTISWSLERREITQKVVSCVVQEHSDQKRLEYKEYIRDHFLSEQLIFVDDSGVNCITSKHNYAWAPAGTCAWCCNFFIRGKVFVCINIFYTCNMYWEYQAGSQCSLLSRWMKYFIWMYWSACRRAIHSTISLMPSSPIWIHTHNGTLWLSWTTQVSTTPLNFVISLSLSESHET